jgi:hypothetical protein
MNRSGHLLNYHGSQLSSRQPIADTGCDRTACHHEPTARPVFLQ